MAVSLQIGHLVILLNHFFIHFIWYSCPHRRPPTSSSAAYSSWHMTHISGSWLGLVVVALQYLICKCCIIVPSDNLLLSTRPICWKCEFNNLKSSCSCSWGSSALGVLETSSYKNSDEEESILDINLCHANIKHELPLAWMTILAKWLRFRAT